MFWLEQLANRRVIEEIVYKRDAQKILKKLEILIKKESNYYSNFIRTKLEIELETKDAIERYENIIKKEIFTKHKEYAQRLLVFVDFMIRESKKENYIEIFSEWFFGNANELNNNNKYFINSNQNYHEIIYADKDIMHMRKMYHIDSLSELYLKDMYKAIFQVYKQKIKVFIEKYNHSILVINQIVSEIRSFEKKICIRHQKNKWIQESFANSLQVIQKKASEGDVKLVYILWDYMINGKNKKEYCEVLKKDVKSYKAKIEIVTMSELIENIFSEEARRCKEQIAYYANVEFFFIQVYKIYDDVFKLWYDILQEESKQLAGFISHIGYIRIYPEVKKGDSNFLEKYITVDRRLFSKYAKAIQLIIDKNYAHNEQWNILQNGFKELLCKNISVQYAVLDEGKKRIYECIESFYLLLSKKINDKDINKVKEEINKVKERIKKDGGIYVDNEQELIKKIFSKISQKIEGRESLMGLGEIIYKLIIENTQESYLNKTNIKEIYVVYNETFKIYEAILYDRYEGEVTDYLYYHYVEIIKSSSLYRDADNVQKKAYMYFIEYLYEKKYIYDNKLTDAIGGFLKKYYADDKQKTMEIPLQILYYLLYIYQRFLIMVVIVIQNKNQMKKYLAINSETLSVEERGLMKEIKKELFKTFSEHKEININDSFLKSENQQDNEKQKKMILKEIYELKEMRRKKENNEKGRSNLPFWNSFQRYYDIANGKAVIRYIDVVHEIKKIYLPSLKIYMDDIKHYMIELKRIKESIKKEYEIEIILDEAKLEEYYKNYQNIKKRIEALLNGEVKRQEQNTKYLLKKTKIPDYRRAG